MNTNDFINHRKNLLNGKLNKVTFKLYDAHIDKATELLTISSTEAAEFNSLLAQYKAKVLERYAFLHKP